ncbi:hypothetical protein V6N12_058095 [Hibiscus sabdariffa]|uniref:Uncharacterized protein n=1 Tax=Hibiscus sabdariffa TaxID=183260 RepID=A0ABR2BP67_9ROSI
MPTAAFFAGRARALLSFKPMKAFPCEIKRIYCWDKRTFQRNMLLLSTKQNGGIVLLLQIGPFLQLKSKPCSSLHNWYDEWISERPLKALFPRIFALAVDKDGSNVNTDRVRWMGPGDETYSVSSIAKLKSQTEVSEVNWRNLIWLGLAPFKVEAFVCTDKNGTT